MGIWEPIAEKGPLIFGKKAQNNTFYMHRPISAKIQPKNIQLVHYS